jgi:hypothetical protein
MNTPASESRNPGGPRHFDAPEHADFARLEHAGSLKGLLKPFKGKGELEDWAGQCETVCEGLLRLSKRLLAQARAYPFTLLPIVLAQQRTRAGTTFLRWRRHDTDRMGDALWEEVLRHPGTSSALADELFALEITRLALNMQLSLAHTLARQARECAKKMAHAEGVYRERAAARMRTPKPEGER